MKANDKIRLEAHINRLLLIVLMFACPNLLYGQSAGWNYVMTTIASDDRRRC